MTAQNLNANVAAALNSTFTALINYLPVFVGGLVTFLIGLLAGLIVNRLVLAVLRVVKLEAILAKYNISKVEGQEISWSNLLAEISRWFVIFVFLVPALQIWKIESAVDGINKIVFYLPNVIVAIILVLTGLIFARLGKSLVYTAAKNLGKDTANTTATITSWIIKVFTAIIALNQLGVANDLLRITFIGLVAMIAIAGGLALGLGASDIAKDALSTFKNKFKGK